jgi:tetratricopeptide (TPR) repeat protein
MLTYLSWLLCLLALGIFPAWGASSSQLQGVRFGWHGAYARIVFDLHETTTYRIRSGSKPSRILVEFPEGYSLPPQSTWHTRNPLVQEVLFRQEANKIISEIRLTQPGTIQRHFRMTAPPRIVIDITRQSSPVSKQQTVPPQVSSLDRPQAPKAEASEPESIPPRTSDGAKTKPVVHNMKRQENLTPTIATETITAKLSQAQVLRQAELQWQQGDFEAAQQSYQAFLERFPHYKHNHLIMVRLADLLQQQQLLREALEAYAEVITTSPSSEGALISQVRMAELGMQSPELLPQSNEPQFLAYHQPLSGLQKLIQTYPASPVANIARLKLGEFRLQHNDLQAALTTFSQLLKKSLEPVLFQEARSMLDQTLKRLLATQQQKGEYLEVLRTFFRNQEHLPSEAAFHPDLLLPVALSYARLGLDAEAQGLLQRLTDGTTPPKQKTIAALEQAQLIFKHGHPQTALDLLEPLVPIAEPVLRKEVLLLLGTVAVQAGEPAKALNYLDMARHLVVSPPERVRLFTLLAEEYLTQGDTPQGLHALQQCVGVHTEEGVPLPETDTCMFRLAGIFFAHRQFESALQEYQQLLQAFPKSHYKEMSLFHMAKIYQELEDEQQTIETLNQLRDSTTNSLWKKVALDYLDDMAWQKHFHHSLAALQDFPTK